MELKEISKTVDEVVKNLIETRESITAYVHNTSIELRRIKQKGMQGYRFYGGEEAKRDSETYDFYMNVLIKLTEKNKTLREIYRIPSKI